MMTLSKRTVEGHLRQLFQKIDQMEGDCELLRRWAKGAKVTPAQRIAFIFKDAIEDLRAHLKDFETSMERASSSSKGKK